MPSNVQASQLQSIYCLQKHYNMTSVSKQFGL